MKRRTLKTRLLAVLLTLCLVVGLTPVYAVTVGGFVDSYEIKAVDADADKINHVTFVPYDDGFYYFAVNPERSAFSSCNHGGTTDIPLGCFDFDDDESYGNVFELKAGKTYCFAANNQDGYDYELLVMRVEVADSFTIPGTMEGYVGQVLSMPIEFDRSRALSTEVTSSDATKVNPSGGNARSEELRLLAEGTATITVTSHTGQVETCVVTVKAPTPISVNETKTVSLQGNERVVYSFTPTQSGTYTMYVPSDYEQYPAELHVEGVAYDMWQADDRRGASAFNLQAGQTYTWEVWANWDMSDCPITLVKADAMTGLALQQTEQTVYAGSMITIEATHTPVYGMDRPVSWSSDNDQVAYVEATSLTSCNIRGVSAGTANITASWTDDNGVVQTVTCKVTVKIPTALAVDQASAINLQPGESAGFSFTAGPDGGEYLFMIPSGPSFQFDWNGGHSDNYGFHTDDYAGFVLNMVPDGTVVVTLTAEDPMIGSSMTVTKADPADDVIFKVDGVAVTAVEGNIDDMVSVDMELVDGNYIKINILDSADLNVAYIENIRQNGFELVLADEGQTTVTFITENGIQKDLPVTVKAYGSDIADKWIGTMEDFEQLKLEYTPAHDGFYYIHYDGSLDIIPAEGSLLPGGAFYYDDGRYHGVVYKLTGGQTYHFVSAEEILGDYAVYLTEVQEATSFSIPATMSGPVDDSQWLEVTYTGAMAPEYKSTNEDVVRIGGSNAHGATVFLIAEGTADIIVTDHKGNQQVCAVTVSGKKPMETFDGWKEMGLAAGKSVTYFYTPEETGRYWINSELNYKLGIELTENGAVVTPEYAFNVFDKCGQIYDLTAGTQYLLTFSSDHSMSTFINSERVEEAFGLYLEETEFHGIVGEELEIRYELLSQEWLAVADIRAKSTNEDVAQVVLCEGGCTCIALVGEGSAEIVFSVNGLEYTCTVEAETEEASGDSSQGVELLQLGEASTVKVQPGEEPAKFVLVPDYSCYYNLTVTTEGASMYASDRDNGDGSEYYEKVFTAAGSETRKLYLEAGETYLVSVVNLDTKPIDMTVLWEPAHALTKVAGTPATCTKAGTEDSYICTECGALFADADGEYPIVEANVIPATGHKLTKTAAVLATCTTAGNVEYYTCDVCDAVFTDAAGKNATTAEKVVIAATGHKLTKTAAVAATCTTAGNVEYYTCAVCDAMFTDAAGKNATTAEKVVIAATGHKLTKIAAVAPTYTSAGNTEHYVCACGAMFADAEGKIPTTAEAVKLAQLVEVKQETAVVTPDAIDLAVKEAETTGEVVIDVTKTDEKITKVELPAEALRTLVEAGKPLSVVTQQATVVLDADTLRAVADAANGGAITIRVEQIDTKTLNKKQKEAIKDHEVLVTISANIFSGDQYIGDFKGGKATVKVPLKLEKDEKGSDYSVFFVDDEGNLEPVECYYSNGDMYFVTDHFSEYIIAKAPVEETDPTVPNTGDNANLAMMTAMLVISVMSIVCIVVFGKKYAYKGKWER